MSAGSGDTRETPGRAPTGKVRLRTPPWALLVVLVAAVLPSAWAISAPLISDDGAILGYVHRHGPLSDAASAQYGMEIVRFWRPVVTASWWVQERTTGVDPLPLRLFNLLGHAGAALLVVGLARRLGAGVFGALLAGVLAGLFPHQGGNVVWIAGRVDSLTVPLVLLAVLLSLDGRVVVAGLATFAACACKELAFVTPVLVVLLAAARGQRPSASLGLAAPAAMACAVALVARRLAIGAWLGGYPVPGGGGLPGPLDLGVVAASGLHPVLWCCALFVIVMAAVRDWPRLRRCAGCALAAAVCLLPLGHLVVGGAVDPLHLRTVFLADLLLCLGIGVVVALPRGQRPSNLPIGVLMLLVPLVALVGLRSVHAVRDVADWRDAGEVAARELRGALDRPLAGGPQGGPLLVEFSRSREGAYVLAWGAADRFRAPFEESPRPVWPWRALFAETPVRGTGPDLARMQHELSDPREGYLLLDPDTVGQVGVAVHAPDGVAAFEAVLATELGYDVAPLPAAPNGWSLADVLESAGAQELYWTVAQARDLGAELAYLQIRALGEEGESLGATGWIPIRWDAEALRQIVRDLVQVAIAGTS